MKRKCSECKKMVAESMFMRGHYGEKMNVCAYCYHKPNIKYAKKVAERMAEYFVKEMVKKTRIGNFLDGDPEVRIENYGRHINEGRVKGVIFTARFSMTKKLFFNELRMSLGGPFSPRFYCKNCDKWFFYGDLFDNKTGLGVVDTPPCPKCKVRFGSWAGKKMTEEDIRQKEMGKGGK